MLPNYSSIAQVFENLSVPLLVSFIVYYVYNYVQQINAYPRGPFPLPIIGNILFFRTPITDIPPVFKFMEMAKKYGQVFTLWIGATPVIVVNNYELSYEANIVRKNDFIDRIGIINNIFKNGSSNIFSTSGPAWEALKKVGQLAARRIAYYENLFAIVNSVADDAIQLMLKEKQYFNPILFIDLMVYNNLASIAYGNKYNTTDDKEFLNAKRVNDEFYDNLGNGLVSDYIPWLRPFYYHRELKCIDSMKASVTITRKHFFENKNTYTTGVTRHFIDCVLEAKEEAIKENSERAKYYTDDNLIMIVSDLFQAGTDTTQTTLRWALLLLGNYPEVQEKISKEIQENIGDRLVTQQDIKSLPYAYAFVNEVLRFRVPAPVGLEHCTNVNTELGGYKLPKNTRVVFNLHAQNNDPIHWDKPDLFNPNRFLDPITGELINKRFSSNVSFGLGRRACPGERLALNNLFVTIVRLIQCVRIELESGEHSADLIPMNILTGLFPKDYKIMCHKRK